MTTAALPRPEPVTRAATIAGAVAGLIITIGGLARALGWLTDDLDVNQVAMRASDLVLGVGALWSVLAPLVLALWARGHVTPLADPRDRDGNPLVPQPAPGSPPAPVFRHDGEPVLQLDDEPGAHAAPEEPPTEEIPVVPPVPEPTPIGDAIAAAHAATQPAMAAVRA